MCTRLVQATAFTFRSVSPTDHFGVLELPDVRSGGSVSAARVEDFGSRGGSLPFAASLHRGQLCADSVLCKVARTTHRCRSRPPQDAAMRPVEATAGAWCSIFSD